MKQGFVMSTFIFIIISALAACGNAPSAEVNISVSSVKNEGTQVNDSASNTAVISDMPDPIKGGPAKIKVTAKGITEAKSSLIGFYAEKPFQVDTAVVSNGQFTFENKDGYVQGLHYIALGNNQFAQIMLGEDQEFEMTIDVANPLEATFKGSLENEVFYENLSYENQFNGQYQVMSESLKTLQEGTPAYDAKMKEKKALEAERLKHIKDFTAKHPDLLFSKFKMAGQNPIIRDDVPEKEKVYHYRRDFWENVDFSDSRLIRTPVINNKLKRYFNEITAQNADSILSSAYFLVDQTLQFPEYYKYFANWVVLEFEPGKCSLMDAEAVFVKMARKYFTRERAFWADSMEVYAIQNRAMEMGNSLIGGKGPNVTVPGLDGKPKTLFDSKADYLVVYLYAPSCEHCQEETPKLVQWYNQNKNNSRDVYAIGIDTEDAEWKEYVKKNGMDVFTNVHDPTNRSIYATYYVDVTPEIYVLNKDREIIGKNLKTFQIETVIAQDKEK